MTRPGSASIGYSLIGEGEPPFLLVHGFAADRHDWLRQAAALAHRHAVVTVDLGGHGATPATPEHGRIEQHGEDVVALLAMLALPPVVLVGHSMGCRIALQAAVTSPAHVAGLVLLDGSRLSSVGENATVVTPENYDEVVPRVVRAMFPNDAAAAEPMVAQALALPRDIGAALFANLRNWDDTHLEPMLDRLEELGLPLLAIQSTMQGDDNRRRSLAAGESTPYLDLLRSRVPLVRVEIVPGVGHYPHHERPEVVNALLESFAADVAPAAVKEPAR